MLKVSAISYINTLPFVYGLKKSRLINDIELQLDYPSICGKKLINEDVQIALVPVVVIPELRSPNIFSKYCIAANGAVGTVCLYSKVPIHKIVRIYLDYQSLTSVALLKLLLKEYWQVEPELMKSEIGFEEDIEGTSAALVIGDRAFDLNAKYDFVYDLSAIWKEMTGFPFVFATWVANRRLSQQFVLDFQNAMDYGLCNIQKALFEEGGSFSSDNLLEDYLNNKISYVLDNDKLKGMELFLSKI
tara:strand:- start:208 stop:942 length:735 start_codon:yes stop_codon:yes gene_type:complete